MTDRKNIPKIQTDLPKTRADYQLDAKLDILSNAHENFTRVLTEFIVDVRKQGAKK